MKGKIIKHTVTYYGIGFNNGRYALSSDQRQKLLQAYPDFTIEELVGLEVDFEIDLGCIPQGFAGYARVNLESEAL